MSKVSVTHGDLPPTLRARIAGHEWDNFSVWEQRDWLLEQFRLLERVDVPTAEAASRWESVVTDEPNARLLGLIAGLHNAWSTYDALDPATFVAGEYVKARDVAWQRVREARSVLETTLFFVLLRYAGKLQHAWAFEVLERWLDGSVSRFVRRDIGGGFVALDDPVKGSVPRGTVISSADRLTDLVVTLPSEA